MVVVGEDSSATYTANSLIFLPPFLCGYYVQRSDNTAAVQSTQLLTHIHTLCVSKRIQTYNTLGIHLQSVKISGMKERPSVHSFLGKLPKKKTGKCGNFSHVRDPFLGGLPC